MKNILKKMVASGFVVAVGLAGCSGSPSDNGQGDPASPSQLGSAPVVSPTPPPPPPLKEATVDGKYTGIDRVVSCTFPNCEQASKQQSVVWVFSAEKNRTLLHSLTGKYFVILKNSGHGYAGSIRLDGGYDRTIKLRVLKAKDIDGVWTATKVKGTNRTEDAGSPQYYQVSAFTFTLQIG
jgi:hypothetical protein